MAGLSKVRRLVPEGLIHHQVTLYTHGVPVLMCWWQFTHVCVQWRVYSYSGSVICVWLVKRANKKSSELSQHQQRKSQRLQRPVHSSVPYRLTASVYSYYIPVEVLTPQPLLQSVLTSTDHVLSLVVCTRWLFLWMAMSRSHSQLSYRGIGSCKILDLVPDDNNRPIMHTPTLTRPHWGAWLGEGLPMSKI